MTKARLLISMLIIMVTSLSTYAGPMTESKQSQPMPVGGMQVLEDNTLYPLWAQKERIESHVVLNFHIDNQGEVSNIRVSHSGGAIFDESARRAIQNTKWEPALVDGKSIAVNFELPFEYRSN